jgi:hypothetical protein
MVKPAQIEFEIELTSPVKMHKFNGLKMEADLKEKTIEEQAEAHGYRCPNGNVAIPAIWIYGSITEAFYELSGTGSKAKTQKMVSSRIQVFPPMIDIGTDKYEIDVASAPAGGTRGGVRDFFVKPRIDGAKISGLIKTTLSPDDVKEKFVYAGEEIGMGSDRKHGYGRYKITKWNTV